LHDALPISSNTSSLLRKCQYMAPRLTPARLAISASEVCVTPLLEKHSSAASIIWARVSWASCLVRLAIWLVSPLYGHGEGMRDIPLNWCTNVKQSQNNLQTFVNVSIIVCFETNYFPAAASR